MGIQKWICVVFKVKLGIELNIFHFVDGMTKGFKTYILMVLLQQIPYQ